MWTDLCRTDEARTNSGRVSRFSGRMCILFHKNELNGSVKFTAGFFGGKNV